MKIPYFCCIGAELKRYAQDFDFMNQVYLYKVPTDDSIDEVLSEDYFKAISNSVLQDDIVYIYEASAETLHECRFDKQNGHITAVPLVSDETLTGAVTSIIHDNLTPNKLLKSDENGKVAASDFSENDFVKVDGSSIMTGPLKFRAGSMRGAVAPYLNGVSFWKMDSQGNITNIANLTDSQFLPVTTNSIDLGNTTHTWKDAYVARVITSVLNNGHDIAVPVTNSADTFALKSQVDDAANSGEQLYTKGVWYAKMYSASTVPTGSEYEGRNYADFSQVDGNNDPIIVVYTYTSGAWALTETITPPKNHNGYMTITSKIWDIAEQSGQQGGLVLWSHNQGTFTPYPRIISFQDATLTGTPTAPTLTVSSPNNQIVNKQSLEEALVNHGTGRNVGDIFFTMRSDSGLNGAVECNGGTYNTTDFTGAENIGQLLEDGKVPYLSLADYATALASDGSVGVFGWDGVGTTTFRVPALNDIFIETGTAAQIGDYLSPKIPNLKGTLGPVAHSGNVDPTGIFYKTGVVESHGGSGNSLNYQQIGADASRASGVYDDNATTVQPNAVRYRAMVQLMISASDEAVATCTNITSQVAANTSAINGADYVVESQFPTAQNNYTWYRKYKSGWVEQGGVFATVNTNYHTESITLPIEMDNANYNCHISCASTGSAYMSLIQSKTTTGFIAYNVINATAYAGGWTVCGMAAS